MTDVRNTVARRSILCFLILTVIGVCQSQPPVFSNYPSGKVHIVSEAFPKGSVLFNFSVSHPSAAVLVSKSGHYTNTLVNLSQTQGNNVFVDVTTIVDLDIDGTGQPGFSPVKLLFSARETGNNNTIVLEISLYITDINDNPPIFQNEPYTWEIKEIPFINGGVGNYYNRITASDLDRTDVGNVRYYLTPKTQSASAAAEFLRKFEMNFMNGTVRLKEELDYEKGGYYQATVIAKDNLGTGHNATSDFIIRVIDVQDQPPFFIGQPYRTTIMENKAYVNDSLITVTARDGDTGLDNPVNYIILQGPCSKFFTINEQGEIITNASLDREENEISSVSGVCLLKVVAQEIDQHPDNQHGNTSTTTEVTITIEDEDDNRPEFNNATYIAEVLENTPKNVPITLTSLQEIRVFDADQDSRAEIYLHLEYPNGTLCNDFDVSPNFVRKNGTVLIRVVNNVLLDFETVQRITFLIVATGHPSNNFSSSATISLSINDMNDNNPQFANTSYAFTILENSPNGSYVGKINATDRDSDEYGPITYSVSGGNNKFAVDYSTGEIRTFCTNCLDREKTAVYYLTFTATDIGGRSNSTSLEIDLTDANDNQPTFFRKEYEVFIQENRTYDNPIIETQASDLDEENTNNSRIIYTIAECSDPSIEDKFNITETGLIYMLSPVDYEKLNDTLGGVFLLIIEANDLGVPAMTGNTSVKITVQDRNDNSPVFTSPVFKASVTENSSSTITNSTTVTTVKADDLDSTPQNKHLQYFITAGAMDMFRINSSDGSVSVQINAKLDRERTSNYNITVIAIDQGSPPLTGTTSLLIEILDVNDEFPVFNTTAYTVDVKENQTAGETGCVVQATDADIDHNLQYKIVNVEARDETGKEVNSSLVQNYFQIHRDNGSVYTTEPPDREVAKKIILTVEVSDINAYWPRPQTANVTVTINLIDINDNDPEFEKTNYSVEVSENAQNPTILLTVSAADKDENRTITYELNYTTEYSKSFSIHRQTGVLQKNGVLDRETSDTVKLIVTATDNGVPPRSSITEITVHVLDFNDNEPNFGNLTSKVSVPENTKNGTHVLTITATDEDFGPNANFTFSVENANGLFRLDSISNNTGILSVAGNLDRELQGTHMLRIIAKDNPVNEKEQKMSSHNLEIKIIDINDNAPMFTRSNYTANILENVEIGKYVTQVLATDADEGNNSVVHYMLNNSETSLFKLDETSGQIYVNTSLIAKTGWHTLHIIAEDNGNPRMWNSSFVYIEVLDVNLNAPVITNTPIYGTIKVYECVKKGFIIYKFNYSDADSGVNAQALFNISDIDGGDSVIDKFKMEPDGSLILNAILDAGQQSSFRFQVQVTDRGFPALSSGKVTVIVEVMDVNDHLPYFEDASKTLTFAENRPRGSYIGFVTAVDPDSDSIKCYYIKGTNSDFSIGLHTGSITSEREFDFEKEKNLNFEVRVEDCSVKTNISECDNVTIPHEQHKAEILVNVNITDVNDNPPIFKNNEIALGMRRKTDVGIMLDISLKTNDYVDDADTQANGRQSWTFKSAGLIELSHSLSDSIQGESGVNQCQDGKKHIICVTGNGTLINNKYYSEDLSGYIIVPVSVSDEAGNDTAKIRIYLIADSQILVMTLFENKEVVAEQKNNIMNMYSNITGHEFVYDWLEDHKTPTGNVDTTKTDLYFHIVEPKTKSVLSATDGLRVVDDNYGKLLQAMQKFNVIQIVSSQQVAADDDSPTKTIYILAAIIALLALTVAVIVYVSLTTRSTYKRKLKAATVNPNDLKDATIKDDGFIPGSNLYCKLSNPLLNAELPQPHAEYDNISMGSNNSLDENSIGDPRKESERDGMEEREVRMDMYMEDSEGPVESPLDAALRLHDMQNKEKKGTASTDTIISPESMDNLVFENAAYVGDFESTEI